MQTYKDKKKYLWVLSALLPLVSITGVIAFQITSNALSLFIPLIFIYVFIPLLDLIFAEDKSNPPESEVPNLEKDSYYSYVCYLLLPVHIFIFFYLIHFIVTTDLSVWMYICLILTMGIFGGLAVNLGHELGHKTKSLDKNLAKFALAFSGYGHFNIEHNIGHHRDVATPEDSASSRFGESIYKFALREIPGGLIRAFKIEKRRLYRKGLSFWSINNQILHSYFMTLIIYTSVTIWLGWEALLVLVLHIPIVWWQLTSANYVEHYGLLRQRLDNGNYERCKPHHSWNSNHLASNLVLYHLQRHSDHHANPARHFQSLRHFDDAPQLPNGYMGLFVIAYFPPLWRKVMDHRVLKLVGNNFDLINN